jgi:hypothetical protein
MHRTGDEIDDNPPPGRPPSPMRGTRSGRTALAAVTALALGPLALVACGDDDGTAAGEGTTTVPATTSDPLSADPAAAAEEFCDAVFVVDALLPQEEPEEDPLAALDAVADTAPAELTEDVSALVADAKEVLPAGGDLSEASEATLQEVYGYMGENCEAPTVSVTAVDYTYTDLPDTVDAGPTLLEIVNEGTEVHEMALVRFNDDVTDSIDDILQLPEEEAMTKLAFVTSLFAEPGGSGYSSATLEPGRYGVVCFIPEGTTPEVVESGGEADGQPHAMLGMTGEFEVA